MIAGIAFGLIAVGTISAKVLTEQFERLQSKNEDRAPIAAPVKPAANQATIRANQKKLDRILANQTTIKKNQATILANQRKILAR